MARLNTLSAGTGGTDLMMSATGSCDVDSVVKRTGTWSYRTQTDGVTSAEMIWNATANASSNLGRYFVRVFFRVNRLPDDTTIVVSLLASNNNYMGVIRIHSDGQLGFYSGASLLTKVGADFGQVVANTWHCLRVDLDTTSLASTAIKIYLDSDTPDFDETYAASIGFNRVGLLSQLSAGSGYTTWFDACACNNTSGSVENGLPSGTAEIVYLSTDGLAESHGTQGTDWDTAPTPGGSPAAQVDEIPADDDASYDIFYVNSTGPTNRYLDFTLESATARGLTASDTIRLVHVICRVRGATSTNCSYQPRLRSQIGGTIEEGNHNSLDQAAFVWIHKIASRYPSLTSYSDPQLGGPWTTALLDTATIGCRASDASPDVYLSSLAAIVEYEPASGGGDISATISVTQGANTVTAAGTVGVVASVSTTQGANTVTGTATVDVQGQAASTQGGDTVAATGAVHVSAAVSVSQGADTVSATTEAAIAATVSAIQDPNTVAIAGEVSVLANVAVAQGGDSITFTVETQPSDIEAVAALTQDGNTVAATSTVAVSAEATSVQASDTVSATAEVSVSATVLADQAGDVASTTASVDVSAAVSVVQDAQTVSATAGVDVAAIVTTTQGANTVSAEVVVGPAPRLVEVSVVQDAQTVSSTAEAPVHASAALSQTGDSVSASGTVSVTATVTAVQAGDLASATGAVDVSATVTAVQASDFLSSNVAVAATAAVSAVQGADTLTVTGAVAVHAEVLVLQTSNSIIVTGTVGALIRHEAIGQTSVVSGVTLDMDVEFGQDISHTQTFDQGLDLSVTYEGV